MGDSSKSDADQTQDTDLKIEIEKLYNNPFRQQPPPYQQQPQNPNQPQSQNYYYNHPSYDNRGTPAYQQRVGGQNVYYGEPVNAQRTPYSQRGQEREDFEMYREMGIFTNAFDTVKIRNRFVQRVYTILSVQLVVTFLFILLATFEANMRRFLNQNAIIFMGIGMVLWIVIVIAMSCCVNLRRSYPTNFILLGILTLALSMLAGTLAAIVPPMVVLAAFGTTAIVVFLVSLFACQTKWDVTGCFMCFCIATLVLFLYGIIILILSLAGVHIVLLHVIYSALAVLLFTFWLMYDTQMVVGGRRHEISPEEYIFGALTLYTDIMIIFMHLLTLYHYCMGGGG